MPHNDNVFIQDYLSEKIKRMRETNPEFDAAFKKAEEKYSKQKGDVPPAPPKPPPLTRDEGGL